MVAISVSLTRCMLRTLPRDYYYSAAVLAVSPSTPHNTGSGGSGTVACRHYGSTIPQQHSWWNPFRSRGGENSSFNNTTTTTTNGGALLGSARSRGGDDVDTPRRIQERKDVMLALLALEFRRLSLEQPPNNTTDRESLIDQSFERLEEKDLDSKTILQLRHELQGALEGQVVQLFQAMRRVDEGLDLDLDDPTQGNELPVLDTMIRLELELTIDRLANPLDSSNHAPRGASPETYLQIRRGALETLIRKRQEYQETKFGADHAKEGGTNIHEATTRNEVTWVDADLFGYHETIDQERNNLIRHHQSINICRAAKLRDDWGYGVIALRSSIAGAGRGVFVDGYARAGSILAFQPGEVWTKENLVSLPVEVERQLEKNDHYQMSLRPDDFMIDSRTSPYTVLTRHGSNPMALGHIVNHPTPTMPPNARCVMVNFTEGMDLKALKHYIPNTYARPRNPTLVGNLLEGGDVVEMQGMCLIATRDICNEEILYDYRLMTSRLPSWYEKVQDRTFIEPIGGDGAN
jgi:hypothetical protein